ncbi:hypothetical protein ES332_D08G036300v1 [Gossypium tomentosum]|uniref:Leucine-rich repeat-containing N-terminal plant-type domain-containing protein n=1 Tax=Gossypium tomentosum TaxID=34277 RepID=A0A5D2JPP5_GOSTO|nr:hypothetical protein ES332_D08G036300v1 [Gossypium tomentosum]
MGIFSFNAIALAFLLAIISGAVNACPPSDREALLALSSSLKEPYLGIFDSWKGTDCCSNWYGISCDPTTHRVTDVSLRGESEDPILQKTGHSSSGYMTGTINPSICQLDRLTTLIIADWKGIAGEIPSCLASLPNLRIGNLQKLTVLNLADNKINGEIPSSIVQLSSLKHLDLSNNLLTGEVPANFGNLKMLSRALLSGNQLTGTIPISISNMYRLADLDISRNKIQGQIPAQLGKMKVLATLDLGSNMLTGEVPPAVLGSTGLGILNLSRNSLEGNIPDVFGPKSYFMALDLSFNNLKGPVPGSLSSAKFVGHLDLSHNHLCGTIPVGTPNDCLCGNPLKTC